MKIEMDRNELKSAVELWLKDGGTNLDGKEIEIKVSKLGVTTVTITDVKEQGALFTDDELGEEPFSGE